MEGRWETTLVKTWVRVPGQSPPWVETFGGIRRRTLRLLLYGHGLETMEKEEILPEKDIMEVTYLAG